MWLQYTFITLQRQPKYFHWTKDPLKNVATPFVTLPENLINFPRNNLSDFKNWHFHKDRFLNLRLCNIGQAEVGLHWAGLLE